jgi:hypothetical protein
VGGDGGRERLTLSGTIKVLWADVTIGTCGAKLGVIDRGLAGVGG